MVDMWNGRGRPWTGSTMDSYLRSERSREREGEGGGRERGRRVERGWEGRREGERRRMG